MGAEIVEAADKEVTDQTIEPRVDIFPLKAHLNLE
jgi:hypothetical protein